MVIENASPALAAFAKQLIVVEMATVLHMKRVNLEDDCAVAAALYRESYSSCAIANLMDEARSVARRVFRNVAAALTILISSSVATSYTTVIASDVIGPRIVEIMEARATDTRSHAARIPA